MRQISLLLVVVVGRKVFLGLDHLEHVDGGDDANMKGQLMVEGDVVAVPIKAVVVVAVVAEKVNGLNA